MLYNLAFGNQRIDTANPDADHSHIVLQQGIYKWAKDTYDFACCKWGEDNIISFAVHCDETSIHAHVQTIPVEKVKKRGRIGSKYVNKNNPDIVLSTKEWRALPKEERDNYTKQTASKDYVECVSYAEVWGETRKAKSEYLSQLHTDYHNEVGCKYGLARGIPYNELSEEEKRGRRHKNKVVLEAERQAKAALDKVEKYAVLATIDKQELTFPLLNIKTPVQEAMDAVKQELAIPIPALIGQKTWREERTTNINDAIKALVTAINVERDKQNYGIRASVNKTYTYYMQQLNKLIIENKALQNENDTLKAENTEVKQRISQLDENAVRRVTAQKDAVIESLNTHLVSKNEDITRLKTDYNTLWEKYKILVIQWNDLTKQPEIIEAVKRVEERKEQEAEAKHEEQARQDRYQGVLDRFISEGHEQLKAFSQSSRIDFEEKEAKAIYYGIMATATKSNITLCSPQGAKFAVERFLASMDWNGCGNYRRECVAHWTKLFATDEVVYTEPIIQNFLSFINHMSCSADTYVSLGGSNGCADQLTNWDGTQKLGLGASPKKKPQGLSR
jgi:plasmid recombination enzyme